MIINFNNIGSGGGSGKSGAVFGYLHEGKFYSDPEHTKEITPAEDTIYVDKTSNMSYTWNGTEYVVMGGGSSEGAVRYDEAQTLTASEQEQARDNIGAGKPIDIIKLG